MNENTQQLQPPAQQQQQGRLPDVSPAVFEAFTFMDSVVGRATLSREEHSKAFNTLQQLLKHVETLEGQVKQFTAEMQSRPPAPVETVEVPASKRRN